MLHLAGFGVAYGPRVVLRDVTLAVPPAGCTVLLGPSGTGKSTLLRTLAGYNRAHADLCTWGTALYAGTACTPQHQPALVMQNSKLLVSNVLENLVSELPARSALTQRGQIEVVAQLLAECGQGHLLDVLFEKVVERSVADQRAIAILRQAMAAPELLMVDEPTAGLPPGQADLLLELMARLARRRALLVVLHHLQQARTLGRQVVLLADGAVQEAQACDAFFERPASALGRLFVLTGSCPESAQDAAEEEPAPIATPHPGGQDGSPRPVKPAAVSAACGPRGFLWLLPGQLAGTPWPGVVHGAGYDLEALRTVGVTRLVSLTEEPFDAGVAAPFGIACRACPMPDMHPPTLEQALALCGSIDRDLAAGEVVAVHCHAGLGRTGTVLAAYWLWLGRARRGALQALEDVRRIEPGWVQSQAQVAFLEEFALVVANMPAGQPARNDPDAAMDDAAAVPQMTS